MFAEQHQSLSSFHDALLLQQSVLWVLTFTCQKAGTEKKKHMDIELGSSGAAWGNRKMSCSKLSLFTIYRTHWCSASCNTAQLVKDFTVSTGILVCSAGWRDFIALFCYEGSLTKIVKEIKSSLEQLKYQEPQLLLLFTTVCFLALSHNKYLAYITGRKL